MHSSLIIEPASQSDIEQVLTLYEHLDIRYERCALDKAKKNFEQILLYQGSAILLGKIGDELVTSCVLVVVPNLTWGGRPYGLIENVVTDAGYRNRGFGKQVLAAALERAWAEDCYKVMLMTGSKDPATLTFYERLGFQQSKTGFEIRRVPTRSG